MKAKTVVTVTGAIGATTYLAYKKISQDFFNKIFLRKDNNFEIKEIYKEWLNQSKCTILNIESFDGLKLNGIKIENHETDNYVILVHGINGNKYNMMNRAYEFDKLGYNCLVIDQRAAGESEGKYYSYGLKESQDLVIWIEKLVNDNPNINIILYGISMGAATVMLSLANKLPSNVKCVIEDCGFSSLEEELDYVIRRDYDLKFTKIILSLIKKQTEEKFGYTLDDVNVKKCLDNNEIPIMFIHGMSDELVPYEMSKKLYNHNLGIKKFYPVVDAKHCEAINDENYFNHIQNFIEKNLY